MTIKVGINGFGRMGRLALRAAWDWPELEFVQINDPAGDAATLAHLLEFDSVHGRWSHPVKHEGSAIVIAGRRIATSRNQAIADSDWSQCDLVIEASGKMKTKALLQAYLDQGVKRVVVTAPVKEDGVANLVMGVNHQSYDSARHPIVTAASCTTNCLAPVVKVIHENFGIRHGSMTTIHDITNTQTILDAPHKDLRRARACGQSLIPTTTGSATAITHIFPELKGRLNGHAVRVPLANASLTDCVFELEQTVTEQQVNDLLQQAAETELKGILGFESRPLVSVDYKTDPRSCIVDGLSTMVINGTQLKLYCWYDNEWGYANRTAELALMVGRLDRDA
ncbi:ArsJ-associated glyceraldehyde-3-phosphate dehydrogenase [Shewanella algae]|uniref:ArsJ-associated glyceraldehyde-3-phosphate dehydrogenase n=1 Tax=Shewanella algae TaxID=38313 RepID=UPI001AADE5DB|nr:ArsJ-associated glyceraldehyde-3-phosphate dehydrogenase [Shewanella algae]MBO2610497.1 ArsJ-associated glyceraldehyde-3-phosphate dehydrogenase [Shewanella algae]MBO2614729.1 ArsJ-associated glyceraldehyde-3-phosphate dehydrogenase [Shewanella algae]MBO2690648.1 ArsJ-associated glyceraldehyde-3-phosphate dehydrogenase [Shewanella algae]MDV2961275.1 ArsJ-associated glyceraldehyde-3-phosphate dehydrogenase [Shewanella algae]QTE81836.1 ArsJ-associated glyceraldehyde-3-phosphate dehydrogenase 